MYILLDLFDPHHIVIVENEDGTTKLFSSREDAQEEADNLQDPLIVRTM